MTRRKTLGRRLTWFKLKADMLSGCPLTHCQLVPKNSRAVNLYYLYLLCLKKDARLIFSTGAMQVSLANAMAYEYVSGSASGVTWTPEDGKTII